MTNSRIDYEESHDLYQQMLWEAQKLEDKRLAKIIVKRITEKHKMSEAQVAFAGNIIPFPSAPVLCLPAEPEISFWKQLQFWQDLGLTFTMLSVGVAWIGFFIYLLTK